MKKVFLPPPGPPPTFPNFFAGLLLEVGPPAGMSRRREPTSTENQGPAPPEHQGGGASLHQRRAKAQPMIATQKMLSAISRPLRSQAQPQRTIRPNRFSETAGCEGRGLRR